MFLKGRQEKSLRRTEETDNMNRNQRALSKIKDELQGTSVSVALSIPVLAKVDFMSDDPGQHYC